MYLCRVTEIRVPVWGVHLCEKLQSLKWNRSCQMRLRKFLSIYLVRLSYKKKLKIVISENGPRFLYTIRFLWCNWNIQVNFFSRQFLNRFDVVLQHQHKLSFSLWLRYGPLLNCIYFSKSFDISGIYFLNSMKRDH